MQMLDNLVDLAAGAAVQILEDLLHLLAQETFHQHHHHKEIQVVLVLLKIQQTAVVAVEALVLLVGMEVLLKVEMVEQDKHHLFLEHQ
jgi:hypothetical protein